MNEVDFRNWLTQNDVTGKIQCDCVSRLKRIERELACDLDEQFTKNKCEGLMLAFVNMGKNKEMERYGNTTFPIGKYYMSTYRRAIKQYVTFKETE